MKKDIQIPEVKGVYVAIVNEYNDIYKTQDWNAYIINDKPKDLDIVLIVTNGYSEDKITTNLKLLFLKTTKCLIKRFFLGRTPLI